MSKNDSSWWLYPLGIVSIFYIAAEFWHDFIKKGRDMEQGPLEDREPAPVVHHANKPDMLPDYAPHHVQQEARPTHFVEKIIKQRENAKRVDYTEPTP